MSYSWLRPTMVIFIASADEMAASAPITNLTLKSETSLKARRETEDMLTAVPNIVCGLVKRKKAERRRPAFVSALTCPSLELESKAPDANEKRLLVLLPFIPAGTRGNGKHTGRAAARCRSRYSHPPPPLLSCFLLPPDAPVPLDPAHWLSLNLNARAPLFPRPSKRHAVNPIVSALSRDRTGAPNFLFFSSLFFFFLFPTNRLVVFHSHSPFLDRWQIHAGEENLKRERKSIHASSIKAATTMAYIR